MNSEAKVILVTGGRTGIGRACAEALSQAGYRVYGTSRDPSKADTQALGFELLRMDVDDAASVDAAIATILAEAGRLDVVVNNGAFGYGGAVENTSIEEAKALFETNFFGVLRVCHAVLPAMRAQRGGLIVNMSSIGGVMGLPYQGLYAASKFAVEGLSESLRLEVKRFGIDVVLLEPGDIRTPFTANRRHTTASQTESTYRDQYAKTLAKIERDEQSGASPEVVGRALLRIVGSRHPRPRYVVGPFYERLAVWAKRLLPGCWFERILMWNYGIE